ncbi:AXIN1.2 family protein [Megaselia abdita]
MNRHRDDRDREAYGQRTQAQGSESVGPIEGSSGRSCVKWAASIDHLLSDEEGLEAFKAFVIDVKGDKDLLYFYFACVGLRDLKERDAAFKMIPLLRDRFYEKLKGSRKLPPLSSDTKKYIDEVKNYIDSTKKGLVNQKPPELNKNIYDPILNHIKCNNLAEFYKSFLESDIFIRKVNEQGGHSHSHEDMKNQRNSQRFISTIKEGKSLETQRQSPYIKEKVSSVVTNELLSMRVLPKNPPSHVPRAFIHTSYAPNSEANSRVQSDCDPEYLECGGSIYGFPLNYQDKTNNTLQKPRETNSSSRPSRPLPPIIPSEETGLMTIPKKNRGPVVKTKIEEENFFNQVANKLKNFEKLQQDNHEIYSRPCERFTDSNGNESDQDILDNHIKSWDLESPGIPVPPIPVRRPINSLDLTNNNMPPPPTNRRPIDLANNNLPPPPNRNLNPYATLPRRTPSLPGPPILPPKPTSEDKTIVIYKLLREEIPTRTKLEGKRPTLKQLKASIMKKGDFRYFCKVAVETGFNVFQEVTDDREELPQFEEKVNCQVAETTKEFQLIGGGKVKVEAKYANQKSIYRFRVQRTLTLSEFKSSLPIIGNYK